MSEFFLRYALAITKYSVSLDADSVKKFLRYALESSRYHVTLDAHRVKKILRYAPESTKLERGGGTL